MGQKLLSAGFVMILLILVQNPLISALNCNNVDLANYNECMNILNSGISDEEKSLLISNLEYSSKFFPDHDFIFQKNADLEINKVPEGVKIYNGDFVKNAWMSIFNAMPSVLYNNILYVPSKTEILTGFNYELDLPSNYRSSRYPKTSQGDCKRTYSLIDESDENRIYVNNKYFGEGDLVGIDITKDSEIKSKYEVNAKVKIRHYKWEKYCSSRRNDGSCRRYSRKCKYKSSEIKEDNIRITDNLGVNHYNNKLLADLKIISSYKDTVKLQTNFSNSVNIDFNNSKFEFSEFVYSINYSKPPYYVYTLKAEDYNQEKLENILKERENLVISNFKDCNIQAYDFFNVQKKTCNSKYENIDFQIKTDKLKYKFNEEIEVNIYPPNISVNVSYGDNIKEAIGKVSFNAKFFKNKISAEYKGQTSEKIIFISNKERFLIIWNLVIFALLNYLLYAVLRKYWRTKNG